MSTINDSFNRVNALTSQINTLKDKSAEMKNSGKEFSKEEIDELRLSIEKSFADMLQDFMSIGTDSDDDKKDNDPFAAFMNTPDNSLNISPYTGVVDSNILNNSKQNELSVMESILKIDNII